MAALARWVEGKFVMTLGAAVVLYGLYLSIFVKDAWIGALIVILFVSLAAAGSAKQALQDCPPSDREMFWGIWVCHALPFFFLVAAFVEFSYLVASHGSDLVDFGVEVFQSEYTFTVPGSWLVIGGGVFTLVGMTLMYRMWPKEEE